MNPFERKVCHDVVASAGLVSESEGAEPHRCVVVLPADDVDADDIEEDSGSGAESVADQGEDRADDEPPVERF